MIMNNYLLLLFGWVILSVTLWALMRIIPYKMKHTDNLQTKSNLFFVLLLFGIPISFMITIVPIVIISGDENMPDNYKFIFAGIVILFLVTVSIFRKKN